MSAWQEYEALVDGWDDYVGMDPTPERYKARWKARISHESWTEKRDALLWMCSNKCERCGGMGDLQLHHLHYDTLWYESHQDLELLCKSCHYQADLERATEEASKHRHVSTEDRARAYMEMANRSSGQTDWPVSYLQALEAIRRAGRR